MCQIIKKYKFLFLCISGVLTAFTVVFPKVGFLEWISLVPASMVLILIADDKQNSLRKIYLHGAVFFMSFYLVIWHWFLYMYPLEFMEVSHAVALFIVLVAWIGLSIVQTVTGSLIFLVFAVIFRCRIFEKIKILVPILAGALWASIEWSQTIGWWGVPWGRLCLGQSETNLSMLSASVFGSYFVTFIIVAVNFCIGYILIRQDFARILSVVCVCLIVGNLLIGCMVRISYSDDGNEKITVSAVQGNIHLNEKWSDGTRQEIEEAQTKYTIEASDNGADLIIWAETAFPYSMDEELAEYFSELAKSTGTTIIASAFTYPETPVYAQSGAMRTYNSLMEVRSDGSFGDDIYSKQRLVPFAEFVPMYDVVKVLLPPFAELNMISDDVLPGDESVVLHTEQGNIGCMICFDSVYENIAMEAVRGGAEMLIVSTNDAWFDKSAENYMHTSQSKLRAVETGRYLVRAANTGISGIINPMGEFEESLGILEGGTVTGDIYLREQRTIYSIIGNSFVYACVGVSAILLVSSIAVAVYDRKKSKENA